MEILFRSFVHVLCISRFSGFFPSFQFALTNPTIFLPGLNWILLCSCKKRACSFNQFFLFIWSNFSRRFVSLISSKCFSRLIPYGTVHRFQTKSIWKRRRSDVSDQRKVFEHRYFSKALTFLCWTINYRTIFNFTIRRIRVRYPSLKVRIPVTAIFAEWIWKVGTVR